MQILLLLGVTALFFCFGYYIMRKIDHFIATRGYESENDMVYPAAIVLGKTELARQVSKRLEENNIRVLHLTEPFLLEQEQNFVYLFALSENDADNIVLYKIGVKLYGIEKMISICNDFRNESMFIKEKIPYLSGKEVTVQRIFDTALQRKEENMW